MSYAADRVADILAEHGEEMTLRRQTVAATTPTYTDVTVLGKRHMAPGQQADPVAGRQVQNLVRVMISNAEIAAADWPGPPKKGDRLTWSGWSTTLEADADTRTDGGETICHFLLVKGGPT